MAKIVPVARAATRAAPKDVGQRVVALDLGLGLGQLRLALLPGELFFVDFLTGFSSLDHLRERIRSVDGVAASLHIHVRLVRERLVVFDGVLEVPLLLVSSPDIVQEVGHGLDRVRLLEEDHGIFVVLIAIGCSTLLCQAAELLIARLGGLGGRSSVLRETEGSGPPRVSTPKMTNATKIGFRIAQLPVL